MAGAAEFRDAKDEAQLAVTGAVCSGAVAGISETKDRLVFGAATCLARLNVLFFLDHHPAIRLGCSNHFVRKFSGDVVVM